MTALTISSILLLSAVIVFTYPDYWHRAKDQDLPCEFDSNETLARACNPGTNVVGTPDNYAGRCTKIRVRCSATTVRIEELNCCKSGSGRSAWERDFGNTSWSLGLEPRIFMLGSCQVFPNGSVLRGYILAAAQNLTKKCAVIRKLHGNNGEIESVCDTTFWALVAVGFLGISIVVGLLVLNNSIEDE